MKKFHDKSRENNIIHNNQQQERVSLFKRLSRTRNSRAFKAFTSALAVIIVFGTTYSLIMPAITVDQESAEEMPGIYLEDDTGAYDADDPDMYEDTYEDMSADADEIGNEPDNQDASYIEGDDWEADGQTYYDDIPDDEAYDDEWSDNEYTDNAAEDEESQPFGENNDLVDQADNENAAAASSYTFDETRMETMLPAETALLGDVTVRIDYNSAALIPDGSIFNAEEVNTWAETEEELKYKEWRLENLKETADALLTDMDSDWSYHDAAFIDTELIDPEGNPEQPESDLYLTINFTNPLYTDKVEFVQFLYDAGTDSEYPVILNPVELGYTEDGGLYAGVFMVDTISAFGVVCGDSLLALEEAQEEDSISAISEMEYPEGEEDIAAAAEEEEEPVEEEISVQSAAETVAVESEAEFAVEPSLVESEVESTAEPVLVESEADSIAEPVLTESETDSAAEAVLTDSFAEPVLDLALLYPAQAFNGSTDEVTVTVRAPEGAFPAGTTMTLRDVDDSTINDITEAVTDDKTVVKKVHAADITFTDGEGNEVEPLAPVQMTMTAHEKQRTEEAVVVHISDSGEVEQVEQAVVSERNGEAKARLTMDGSETESAMETDSGAESIVEDITDTENVEEYTIEAESFSIYAIVYTVDFHWEVDGKTYDFSIPGGGFISFAHIIEALGISSFDGYRVVEASSENAGEKSTADKESAYKEAIRLNDAEVSNETRDFLADVEQVRFSNPELVWIEKVQERTTIGAMKEAFDLDVEYSADLTEEQINEINAQSVEDGDWALISLHPFKSEESLTVTMKDGEVFTIKVTDGQLHTYVISDSGDTYEVIVTYDDTAEIPEDARLEVSEIGPDSEKYAKNIELTNAELAARNEEQVYNPVQFDISIVSGDKIIEPKEGSKVNVEIRLAKSVFGDQISEEVLTVGESVEAGSVEEELSALPEETASDDEKGMFLVNGQFIEDEDQKLTECRAAHITDEGNAELIGEVQSSVADDRIIMQFETESFSDYLFAAGNSGNGLYDLPNTIYVGDEIYMWHEGHMWVSNIGSVVTETKHNNSDDLKTVTAINTGTFRIYNRNNQGEYKEITVRPARTGTTPPATIDTVDNASIGITLNLFDYDLDSSLDSYFNGSSHPDNPISQVFLNENGSINQNHALKFWGSGMGSDYGSHNEYNNTMITNIVYNNTTNGYPVLRTNNTSLDYLFTPSNGTDKKAYTNVNHLFKKEGDYYVYDSNVNYAYYDESQGNGGNFAVYNSTYKQKRGGENGSIQNKAIGFFPFHPWDDQYDLYVNWNKNLNHHFGMSMSVDFSLPKDPKAVVDTEGNPIVFEFSGDDDLWVFIDGKLAMDIGGIHQPTSGTINFQDGTVKIKGSTEGSVETTQMNNAAFTSRFSNLYDGNTHTMQVFYIERGGCDSNCKIKFNMTQYGHIYFNKVDEDNPDVKLKGAVFGIYKDQACTQPLMENLKNNTSRAYIAESDANGKVTFSDIPLGDYYLKELNPPEGYPLDSTVHSVRVFLDTSTGRVRVVASIKGINVESPGVEITNKKPIPIDLGLLKEWKNQNDETIPAPEGASAIFELKRIRTYETYTEEVVEGSGRAVSHLKVGWIHNGEVHDYAEYDLVSGTQATVSWQYINSYTGSKDCIVNGTRIDKDYVSSNVVSEALTMPADGETATFYIVDESDNGQAISSINVAGDQFFGNSGGGVIHHFTTVTEPDLDFHYSGEHVTDNQVTLPIGENTWDYNFVNLPLVGTSGDGNTVYSYTYYLDEVSNVSPEGTTVVYKDLTGNVIQSASDAETSQSGTQTITNKVPTGYLRVDKAVTYNGISPVPDGKKSDLAGTYTFKVYTDANCSKPYKVIQGEAPNQQEVDLVLTVTIGDDGEAQSSETVKIPVGDYWIEEQTPIQTGVTPDENRIKVTITADQTASEPAIASFTNNKEESNSPDELTIELEKTFTGLPNASKIPADFQAVLTYTNNGDTVTIPLTGSSQGNVTCVKSNNDLTWHWRIKNIPKTATNFGVYESNYDITGYTRITKINGSEVQNPGVSQTISVLRPEITMTNPTSDYTTTDKNKVFTVADNQILLVRMTSQATVIVSQKSLSLATRQGIEKLLQDNGGKIPGDDGANAQWVMNFVYFSHEIQGDSFSYGGRTIFFDGNLVKIPHKSSSHEVRVDVGYTSTTAENSFTLENIYTEIPTEVDVLKVEKDKETTTHLPDAGFELRKLEDVAPTNPGGSLTYVKDDHQQVIVTSKESGPNGRLTFDNLTYGVYEIREVTPPPGYILTEDVTFYLRVDGGVITYVQKGSNKPSEWTAAPNGGATVYFMEAQAANPDSDPPTSAANATFRVGNTPGAALPSTGGPGTRLFTILGGILILGAGVLLWRRRRLI